MIEIFNGLTFIEKILKIASLLLSTYIFTIELFMHAKKTHINLDIHVPLVI